MRKPLNQKRVWFITAITLVFLGGLFAFSCSLINKIVAPVLTPIPLPLTMRFKDDICQKLDINNQFKVCKPNQVAYAKDMYLLFEQYFKGGKFTYEEIYNLFDPSVWLIANPFRQLESDYYAVFDLTGTGNSPIYFYSSDNDQIIRSIVFIRPDTTIIPKDRVRDICNIFSLPEGYPICMNDRDIYINDFIPIMKEKFDTGRVKISDFRKLLSTFAFTEKVVYPKLYFEFHDSNYSRILFYFDESGSLEHFVFLQHGDTTIIDRASRTKLCIKFKSTTSKKLCNVDSEITMEDAKSIIREEFPKGIATYEDVQNKLGKYQIDFDPPVIVTGYEPVVGSWYDLAGNYQFRIKFNFDLNFVVTGISFISGGDS